jgi:hypothetical protein
VEATLVHLGGPDGGPHGGAACLAITRIILWPTEFQLPNAVEVFRLKLYLSDVEGAAIGGEDNGPHTAWHVAACDNRTGK